MLICPNAGTIHLEELAKVIDRVGMGLLMVVLVVGRIANVTDSVSPTNQNQSGIAGRLVFRERPGLYPLILGVNAEFVWHAYYTGFFVSPLRRWSANDDRFDELPS
jgi:hypothetical protein